MSIGTRAFASAIALLVGGCGGDAAPIQDEEPAGEAVVEVHLDADALALSDVRLGQAGMVPHTLLSVTGTITYDQNRLSQIAPKTQGRIVEVLTEVGARVRAGEVLVHLESPEVGMIRADLAEAEALVEIARENFDREVRLEAQGISSRRELLDAEATLRRVEASRRSAEERLRVLDAGLHGEGGHFDITSPFDGIVVERDAGVGEVVGPSDPLATVADLGQLWIELDIYERDLAQVREGLPVTVSTAAWPGRTFPASVGYVADILDTERRTVRARVVLDNRDGALKPGMFATASIQVGEGRLVAVPRDAVQDVEGQLVVWVPGDEEGSFVVRPVVLGAELPGDYVEVVSGISEGETLVVTGAFTLKAELAKGEFGGHGH